jgi:hypothetical protein
MCWFPPASDWSVTAQLPPRTANDEYVINHVTRDPVLAPLRLRMTVYGNRAVLLRVQAHSSAFSPELAVLALALPDWATLDPHGSYAVAGSNHTLAALL